MKRLLFIFLIAGLVFSLSRCAVYDSDNYDLAQSDLTYNVIDRAVTPLSRIVELSDFYYRYRSVMDNPEFAQALKDSYFGEDIGMSEYGNEGVDVEYWGHIELSEDNDTTYCAVLSSYWTGLEPSYSVIVNGLRDYTIVYDSDVNDPLTAASGYSVTLTADVVADADGNGMIVNDFDLSYTEIYYGSPLYERVLGGSEGETLRLALCSWGKYTPYPMSGVMYYYITGFMTDSFKVEFYGDRYEVTEGTVIQE